MEALMNRAALLEVAVKVFSSAPAQVPHVHLTTPSEQKIPGRIRIWENILRASKPPVTLIITFLGLTTCIALPMVFLEARVCHLS